MPSSECIYAPSPRCRVCLAGDMRMYCIRNTRLLEVYEKLASTTKLNAEEGRVLMICYFCHSQLQRCCSFSDMCHQSEQLLGELLRHGNEAEGAVLPAITHNLTITALPSISMIDDSNKNTEVKVKEEPLITEEDTESIEERDVESVNVTSNDNRLDRSQAEGAVPAAITHNLTITALPSISMIDDSNKNTEVKVKEEPLITEEDTESIEERDVESVNVTSNDNRLDRSQVINSANATRFVCEVCNKTLLNKKLLARHMLLHFNIKPEVNDTYMTLLTEIANFKYHQKTTDKTYFCKTCKLSFSLKETLTFHIQPHSKQNPYHCNMSKKSFIQSNLNWHMETLDGDKQYICDYCNTSYSYKKCLKAHIRFHTGENRYYCEICDKLFTQKLNLDMHMRMHSAKRPYRCNICSSTFSDGSYFKRHVKVHREKSIKLY